MIAKNLKLISALLWKNFRLRVKNSVPWIFEIILPSIFMILLKLFGDTMKPENQPDCALKAKALPSASGMLFLQTFLCAADNVCEDEEKASFESFRPSIMSNVGEALKKEFSVKSKRSKEFDVNKWLKDLYVIDSLIEAINNENEKWLLLYNILLRSDIYSATSENENFNMKNLLRLRRNIHTSGLLSSFSHTAANEGENPLFNFLNLFFCGPNMSAIEVQLMEATSVLAPKETEEDPDMSDECNHLLRALQKTSLKLILRYLKPLLFGKIVFTPDAPVVTRIMKRVGESFTRVKEHLDSLMSANTERAELRAWKLNELISNYKNEENFLREAVKTKAGRAILETYENETGDVSDEIIVKRKINTFKNILSRAQRDYSTYLQETDAKMNFSNMLSVLKCIDFDKMIAAESEDEGLEKALKFLRRDRLWAYVIFTNVPPGAEQLPPSITYKMRMASDRAPNTLYEYKVINKTGGKRDPLKDLKEIQGGTVHLQNMIEGELIREYTGRKEVPGIYLKQLPYPCHQENDFIEVETGLLKFFLFFGFIMTYCRIIKKIVLEKEILFKEILRIFGVSNAHHWIAFFIEAFFTGLISVLILSAILKAIFRNFLVIFIFLLAFMIALITMAFLFSTFILRSSYCTIAAAFVYVFLVLFDTFVSETTNPIAQIFFCFISIWALSYGITWIKNMMLSNMPLTLGLMNYAPDRGSPLTMMLIIFMLLIDSVIYILLTIYFENVISTRASRRPWNYCLNASYWQNCFKKNKPTVEFSQPENQRAPNEKNAKNFETEPDGPIGIEVINVSKEFGKSKDKVTVVNNLSINFYENQITSFLGHNGAGKSTTVLMMTGVLSPTKGTIRIYGVDLRKNPEQALKNVGICFQENVILGDLTVRDHLVLIGKLKGLGKKELKRNISELLENFELTSRAGQRVKQLSGGWKRKVCIAMAFMGGSRTIFLDEPTAGIDPFARRSLWNILVQLKKNRTIVLITHHLDEAEILGDRIAIIASGEVKCCGSSSFLKSKLDKGYILTVDTTVRPESTVSKKSPSGKKLLSPQAQELLGVVKGSIGGSEFEEERGCEYLFSLPPKQSSSDLNRLFEALDRNKKKMNINSYGVSAVSLEEVFMKVLSTAEANETNQSSPSQKPDNKSSDGNVSSKLKEVVRNSVVESEERDDEKKKIFALRQKEKFRARMMFWNHFTALWIKRGQHYKKNYIFLLFQFLLPLGFVLAGLLSTKMVPQKLPSASVDVSAYESAILFYTNNIPANPLLSSYENALLGPYGLGIKCILSPEKCSLKSIPKGSLVAEGETIASNKCTCENGELECRGNATAEPPQAEMTTGHKLFNMSGLDLHNWLISTEFKYSVDRIGGISFGHVSPLTGVSVADFLDLINKKNTLSILEKYMGGEHKDIDPKELTSAITSGLDKDLGKKVFEDKDPADNIIIWFNSVDKIASMALVNGVTNLVLRASLPNGSDPSSYSIQLIVHPFPKTGSSDLAEERSQMKVATVLILVESLAFLFAFTIIPLVEESSCGMKHLTVISGVNPLVYWCAYFVLDLVIFSIYFAVLLVLLIIFDFTSFCGSNTLPVFAAVFYSYAATSLIFLYLISHAFNKASSAVIFIVIWIIVVGGISYLIFSLFSSLKSLKWIADIFLLLPECCLSLCLDHLALTTGERVVSSEQDSKINYFEWDHTTQYIIRILINGGVYLIILMLIDFRNVQPIGIFTRIFMSLKLLCISASGKREQDEDVVAEKERVRSKRAKAEGDLLIVKNLTKIYCGQTQPAADKICVGVKPGECLGLLGMNGAGKTTIFKMISGTTSPTFGDASIRGFSITCNPIKSRILIGYCPQVNALDPYLTPIEHLSFFCRIRGYSSQRRNREVEMMIELLNLSSHKNKLSKALSGGNKRKLNAAIALLSEPELILLDEPTAGMDVMARRFLWSRLLEVLRDGRCLVLTTHSMEECQALATQVCIMFKGRFLCFGTSQHLKNKFNDGYSVSTRLTNADHYKDVINYFNDNLPGFSVTSLYILHLKIKLHPDTNLGKALSVMGEIKKRQWIEDYSVNQTTLESVFLKLIGDVDREKDFKKPCCSC